MKWMVKFKKYTELICIPNENLENVKELYANVEKIYKNHVAIKPIQIGGKKEYKCEKCNRIFDQKSHYVDHINKKNPCDKITVTDLKTIMDGMNDLKSKTQKMEKEMNKLRKENEKMHIMEKDMKALKKEISDLKKKNLVTNNNTQNIETVNILLLNAYGKEDLTHLSSKDIRTISLSNPPLYSISIGLFGRSTKWS
jgi:uncharacterized C2H2 Zn-finger protein